MNLKDKFLRYNDISEIHSDELVKFLNELNFEDEEIVNHFSYIRRNVDFEKAEKELEERIAHGYEVPELLRKNK